MPYKPWSEKFGKALGSVTEKAIPKRPVPILSSALSGASVVDPNGCSEYTIIIGDDVTAPEFYRLWPGRPGLWINIRYFQGVTDNSSIGIDPVGYLGPGIYKGRIWWPDYKTPYTKPNAPYSIQFLTQRPTVDVLDQKPGLLALEPQNGKIYTIPLGIKSPLLNLYYALQVTVSQDPVTGCWTFEVHIAYITP